MLEKKIQSAVEFLEIENTFETVSAETSFFATQYKSTQFIALNKKIREAFWSAQICKKKMADSHSQNFWKVEFDYFLLDLLVCRLQASQSFYIYTIRFLYFYILYFLYNGVVYIL